MTVPSVIPKEPSLKNEDALALASVQVNVSYALVLLFVVVIFERTKVFAKTVRKLLRGERNFDMIFGR